MREGEKGFGRERFEKVKGSSCKRLQDALENGMVDKQLVELCKYIASTKNYSTSSGCAGRIMLLGIVKEGSKKDSYFHRRWHSTVESEEVLKALGEDTKGEIWFKQEPFILHIGCKDLAGCRKILSVMGKAGVKRGGIIVAKEGKFLIELQGTQAIAVPLKKGKTLLAEKKFIGYLVKRANEKIMRNYAALERFEHACRAELK